MLIFPWKPGSRGANGVKTALRERGIPTWCLGDKVPKNVNSICVNWGRSNLPFAHMSFPNVINPPLTTGMLSNKLKFFQRIGHTDDVPAWTTIPQEAMDWNCRVFARFKLEASGGEGIVDFDPAKSGEFPSNAPLYTKYIPKTHEYRVHVGRSFFSRGEAAADFRPILVQRKIFKRGHNGLEAPKDWGVRNHDNGFIYVQNDGNPVPDAVVELALTVARRDFPTIHFCAFDIIYSSKTGKAHVLEGNTAPGLEGQSIIKYADYFEQLHKEIRK